MTTLEIRLLYGIKSKAAISLPFSLHCKSIAAMSLPVYTLLTIYRATNSMELQLHDTCGQQDISITQYLVQHGLAEHIPEQISDKGRVPSRRAPSGQRSRRQSEVEVGDSVSCQGIPG